MNSTLSWAERPHCGTKMMLAEMNVHEHTWNCCYCQSGIDRRYNSAPRGISTVGSAPPCHGGGHEFEPRMPLNKRSTQQIQMDNTMICKIKVRRFKSSKPVERRFRISKNFLGDVQLKSGPLASDVLQSGIRKFSIR